MIFGRKPYVVAGKNAFFDFLQSVADAELVMRAGEAIPTRSFLDSMSETISCLMVTYSPHFGICSTIEITATFGSDVQVDFTIKHIQSIEGEDLADYTKLTIGALVLSCMIFLEKIYTIRQLNWHDDGVRRCFIVDMLVQVVLPILYFSIKFSQILKSGEEIRKTVGVNGIAGVPWERRDVELDAKIDQFFDEFNRLENLNERERSMNILYFVLSAAQLIRLIVQTRAHPRTAMLVNTLSHGLDDLWHFSLLLMIVMIGFIMLGTAQFAGSRSEFASQFKAFEMLWEMLLGSMPQSGAIPSTFWTYDKLMMIYLMLYNFLCFMFMFNFIIAIICESYVTVTHAMKKSEAEQEFFHDVASVTVVSFKSFLWRWPPHGELVENLKKLNKTRVSFIDLRTLFPGINPHKLKSIVRHYRSFEHIRRFTHQEESESQEATGTMMKQLSVMLGVPVPSMHQCLVESKKLQRKGRVNHLVDEAHDDHKLERVVKQQEQTIKMLKKVLAQNGVVTDDEENIVRISEGGIGEGGIGEGLRNGAKTSVANGATPVDEGQTKMQGARQTQTRLSLATTTSSATRSAVQMGHVNGETPPKADVGAATRRESEFACEARVPSSAAAKYRDKLFSRESTPLVTASVGFFLAKNPTIAATKGIDAPSIPDQQIMPESATFHQWSVA
jgi:hypothetical protein